MSDYKIKNEIKKLQEIGLNEEFATLVTAAKYGNLDMASNVLEGFTEENQEIKQLLEEVGFKPFEPIDTTGYIVEPSSSSSMEVVIEDNEQDNQINIEELSNDIIENNDKNQE
jgi:hypothetical protein